MKQPITVVLALVAISVLSAPAEAWDRTGHQVVARIAWEEMSPAARTTASELLRSAPEDSHLRELRLVDLPLVEAQRRHFQLAAYWPDIVRNGDYPERRDKYHHGDWHWINHFFEQRGPNARSHELTDREPKGLIIERLSALVAMLGDRSLPASERAIYLAWVLHLAGDIHQPLHATARVTATEPEGDRGGNLFELDGTSNLHYFWDRLLRSSNFRWFFQSEDSYLSRIAQSITREYPVSDFGERLGERDFHSWARESFAISMADVYPRELERGGEPRASYARRAVAIARERVALAGYRLAAVLEDALAETNSKESAR